MSSNNRERNYFSSSNAKKNWAAGSPSRNNNNPLRDLNTLTDTEIIRYVESKGELTLHTYLSTFGLGQYEAKLAEENIHNLVDLTNTTPTTLSRIFAAGALMIFVKTIKPILKRIELNKSPVTNKFIPAIIKKSTSKQVPTIIGDNGNIPPVPSYFVSSSVTSIDASSATTGITSTPSLSSSFASDSASLISDSASAGASVADLTTIIRFEEKDQNGMEGSTLDSIERYYPLANYLISKVLTKLLLLAVSMLISGFPVVTSLLCLLHPLLNLPVH
jgi:hypothetical protein